MRQPVQRDAPLPSDQRSKPRKWKKKKRKRPPGQPIAQIEHTTHEPPARAALRVEVREKYVSDPKRRTIAYWQELLVPEIPRDTVYSWSKDEQWAKLREQFWGQVESQLSRKLIGAFVDKRAKELIDLESLRTAAKQVTFEEFEGEVQALQGPRDFGQAVDSLIKADKRLDEKRDLITATVSASVLDDDEEEEQMLYSAEELRTMAEARIRMHNPALEASTLED